MPDPASSGRRRVGLAQFARIFEQSPAIRMAEEFANRYERMAVGLFGELPRPDPARPPAAASRRKRKKPRGKTADQRLAELWETDEGRYWLVATARSVEEVAQKIRRGRTVTKDSPTWKRIIAVERKAHRSRLKLERWERDERRRC